MTSLPEVNVLTLSILMSLVGTPSIARALPPAFVADACEDRLIREGFVREVIDARGLGPVDVGHASLHRATIFKTAGLPNPSEVEGRLLILPTGEPFVFGPHYPYGPLVLTIDPPSSWLRVEVGGRAVLVVEDRAWTWAPGVTKPRGRDPAMAAFARAHEPALAGLVHAGHVTLDDLRAARPTPIRWELDDEAWVLRIPRPHGLEEFFFFTARPDAAWPAAVVLKDFVPHRDVMEIGDELLYAARVPSTPASVAYRTVPNVDLTKLEFTDALGYLARVRPDDVKRLLIAPSPVTPEELPRLRVETAYERGDVIPLYVVSRPGPDGEAVLLVDLSYSAADLQIKFHQPTTLDFGDGRRVRVRFDGDRWVFTGGPRRSAMAEFRRELDHPVGARLRVEQSRE